MNESDYPYSFELGVYEDSARGFLSMWNMDSREQGEWHLQQARQAQEWAGVYAEELECLEKSLPWLFNVSTRERYDPNDTDEERHKKDTMECLQIRKLHQGQRLGTEEYLRAIRRCREARDVGEILAHVETQLLAKTWHALAETAERMLGKGAPHHGDAQWATYRTVVKERLIEWKEKIGDFHTRNAG